MFSSFSGLTVWSSRISCYGTLRIGGASTGFIGSVGFGVRLWHKSPGLRRFFNLLLVSCSKFSLWRVRGKSRCWLVGSTASAWSRMCSFALASGPITGNRPFTCTGFICMCRIVPRSSGDAAFAGPFCCCVVRESAFSLYARVKRIISPHSPSASGTFPPPLFFLCCITNCRFLSVFIGTCSDRWKTSLVRIHAFREH